MIKNSNIGDAIAAEMSETLEKEEFKRIFASPVVESTEQEYSEALSQDPNYRAFVRFASKKKDEDKDDKDDKDDKKKGKPKKGEQPPWLKGKNKGKKGKKECKCKGKCKCKKGDDDDKCAYAGAINHVINTLVRTSEALEGMGLVVSAAESVKLLDRIINEAAQQKFSAEYAGEELEPANEELGEPVLEPPPLGEEIEEEIDIEDEGEEGDEETELAERIEEAGEIPEALEADDGDFVMEDPEIVQAFQELNQWVKQGAEEDDDDDEEEEEEEDEEEEDEKDEKDEKDDENDLDLSWLIG